MSAFKIQNKHLVGLASWLNELQLGGKESRERTRFVGLLVEKIQETEKFRNELLDKYVEKDKDGQRKKKMNEAEQEVWDISEDNIEKYQKEYADLLEDEFVLDSSEGNKEKLKVVKDIVLNTTYIFGPKEGDDMQEKVAKIRQANDYEVWCKAFETVTFE